MEVFNSIRKPGWFYESLPYVYTAIGLVVMVALPSTLGVLSGCVLIVAGVHVYCMRRSCRKEMEAILAKDAACQPRHESDDKVESAEEEDLLIALVWRKAYESGIQELDVQHRRLFDMGNMLLSSIISNKPSSEISVLLETLMQDVSQHFRTEEILQFSMNCPNAIEHQRVHQELWNHATQVVQGYRESTLGVRDVFGFIAYDLIAMHIATEDRKAFSRAKEVE